LVIKELEIQDTFSMNNYYRIICKLLHTFFSAQLMLGEIKHWIGLFNR